jgi:hypothetical protein
MLIKSRKLTWAGHAAHTEMKNANIRKHKMDDGEKFLT